MNKIILFSALAMLIAASCTENNANTENITDSTEMSSSQINISSGEQTFIHADENELAGIRKALDLYCEASVQGDSKVAAPAFASTATMSFVEDGKLVSVPIQALFDYYNATGKQPASYEIVSCDVATDVAIVSIKSQFGDARFEDMFTLVKDGDDWKIISKVYHLV